jgi:hypothetical protein
MPRPKVTPPSSSDGAGWYFFDSPEREPLGSNERQRRLIALGAIRGEVNNGGFHQFLFNSSGHLALDAALAAREAGEQDLDRLITSAMGRLGEPFPTDRDQRQSILAKVPDDAFDVLDREYYDLEESHDLDAVMDRYVWQNADDFFDR